MSSPGSANLATFFWKKPDPFGNVEVQLFLITPWLWHYAVLNLVDVDITEEMSKERDEINLVDLFSCMTCINLFNLADVVSRWAFLERRHCTRQHGHVPAKWKWRFARFCFDLLHDVHETTHQFMILLKKRLRYWTETCLQTVISIKHIDLQRISREMVFNFLIRC